MKPVLMTTFRQCIVFPEPPPLATRRALMAAGFRYDGKTWSSTRGTTSAISASMLDDILKAMTTEK